MADYSELIRAVSSGEDIHSPVEDTEEAIIVNTATRDFTLGEAFNPIIGVVGDKNSEVVSFKIDRYIDKHDISACKEHKVNWKNKGANKEGTADIKYVSISEKDENTVILGWLVDEDVTQEPGEITFALEITDYDQNGQVIYKWKTIDGKGAMIADTEFDEEYPSSVRKSFVYLVDQGTGEKYKVYISNGKMVMESEV